MATGYKIERKSKLVYKDSTPIVKKKNAATNAKAQKNTDAGRQAVQMVGMKRGIALRKAAENSSKNVAENGRIVRASRAIEKKRNVANSAMVNKPKKESGTARKRTVK